MSKAAELAALIANVNKGSSLAAKNFVQNGSFQVWQRATSATAQTDGGYKTADRWFGWVSGGGAYTTEKSTGNLADTGHENALKVAVTTADTSIASGDYYAITHRIEAQNLQSLQYGSANAKPVTLSFWVKATKTGINTLSLTKDDSTAIRMVKEYTINSSNTWEYKTMTFNPDSSIKTAASAIVNDNGRGFQLNWVLKYGSTYDGTADAWTTSSHFTTTNGVNNMDSTSNTFFLTGVQLEIGEKATEFEHEPYETTLSKCLRYYQKHVGWITQFNRGLDSNYDAHVVNGGVNVVGFMRATPTETVANVYRWDAGDSDWTSDSTAFSAGIGSSSQTWVEGYYGRQDCNAVKADWELIADL